MRASVTRSRDLSNFGQLFKPFSNIFWAIFRKVSECFIFLRKSFLRMFYRHLATFYWSHCWWVQLCVSDNERDRERERERERVKQIESQLWDFYLCICCKILSEEKICLCQIRKTRDKREKTFLKTGHNLFLQNSQSVSPSISRWVRTTTKNYFTFLLTVIGVLK